MAAALPVAMLGLKAVDTFRNKGMDLGQPAPASNSNDLAGGLADLFHKKSAGQTGAMQQAPTPQLPLNVAGLGPTIPGSTTGMGAMGPNVTTGMGPTVLGSMSGLGNLGAWGATPQQQMLWSKGIDPMTLMDQQARAAYEAKLKSGS